MTQSYTHSGTIIRLGSNCHCLRTMADPLLVGHRRACWDTQCQNRVLSALLTHYSQCQEPKGLKGRKHFLLKKNFHLWEIPTCLILSFADALCHLLCYLFDLMINQDRIGIILLIVTAG